MPLPPIAFTDIGFLFAIGAVVLLLTTEIASSYYGQTNLVINNKRLKNAAYFTGFLFLITVVLRIVLIIFS
jgi:hypothetical protein